MLDGQVVIRIHSGDDIYHSCLGYDTSSISCAFLMRREFLAINLRLGIHETADNQSAFARKHKLNQSLISRCLREGQYQTRDWVFKWKEKKED